MAFDSLEYLAFLAAVVGVVFRLNKKPGAWAPGFLLFASFAFYAFAGWLALALFLASILVNQGLMERLARTEGASRRNYMALGVIYNLLYLFSFKYAAFFHDAWGGLGQVLGLWTQAPGGLKVVLPVGISFYTFESLSVLTDVYRRRYAPPGLREHALFISFFPHLIAGPILRGGELLPQLQRLSGGSLQPNWMRGAAFLSLGFFKKAVLADLLGRYADPVFQDPAAFGSFQAGLALYAFAFQIFFDFSAYSDMAEGSAALFGIRLTRNFRHPYSAQSLSDFWRRWHISLSSWLRDYLYVPLGGSRQGVARTYAALFVTMLLGGLWHGASWNFVIWGAYHGALLGLERALGLRPASGAAARPWRSVGVFHLVLLGWLIFRCPDPAALKAWSGALLGGQGAWGPAEGSVILVLIGAWAFARWDHAWQEAAWGAPGAQLGPLTMAAFQAGGLAFKLAHSGLARPFIYFRF